MTLSSFQRCGYKNLSPSWVGPQNVCSNEGKPSKRFQADRSDQTCFLEVPLWLPGGAWLGGAGGSDWRLSGKHCPPPGERAAPAQRRRVGQRSSGSERSPGQRAQNSLLALPFSGFATLGKWLPSVSSLGGCEGLETAHRQPGWGLLSEGGWAVITVVIQLKFTEELSGARLCFKCWGHRAYQEAFLRVRGEKNK